MGDTVSTVSTWPVQKFYGWEGYDVAMRNNEIPSDTLGIPADHVFNVARLCGYPAFPYMGEVAVVAKSLDTLPLGS